MRSQCDRCCLRFMPVLMDRAVRSPFHNKKGARRGPRARQCASAAPHGNLPCGAALAHWPLLDSNRMGAHAAMCAGGVLVLLSILLLLLLLLKPRRVSKCLCVWGVVCLFGSLCTIHLTGCSHVFLMTGFCRMHVLGVAPCSRCVHDVERLHVSGLCQERVQLSCFAVLSKIMSATLVRTTVVGSNDYSIAGSMSRRALMWKFSTSFDQKLKLDSLMSSSTAYLCKPCAALGVR